MNVCCAVGGVDLTPELQEEYSDLVLKADQQTFEDRKELGKVRDLLTGERGSVAVLEEQVEEISGHERGLQTAIAEVCRCSSRESS
jgi:hypothetical protein